MTESGKGTIRLAVDGRPVEVPEGTSAAAAVFRAGGKVFRNSATGMPRGPVCGMGICFECCVTVDGHPHIRSCMTPCREGMEIRTA